MDSLSERIAVLSPEERALLSSRLQERGWTAAASRDIPRRSHAGPVRLSFAQERLWFLDDLEPGNPAYNAPFALRLTGRLDVRVLEQSVGEIVRRHEVLRTSFSAAADGPVATISPPVTWKIPILGLGEISPEDRMKRARELAIGERGGRSTSAIRP